MFMVSCLWQWAVLPALISTFVLTASACHNAQLIIPIFNLQTDLKAILPQPSLTTGSLFVKGRAVRMGFTADRIALGQVFVLVMRCSPVSIILVKPSVHSSVTQVDSGRTLFYRDGGNSQQENN
jgi:hypothetical protein